MNELLDSVEINPSQAPTASVIWLHGLGADGNDFAGLVPELDLPDSLAVRFVFPHAPVLPVTINNGYVMPAWYDILGLDAASREDEAGVRKSAKAIEALIAREQKIGIPTERIVLAGFSQGGAMALHTGLRFAKRLAGIMALSTYLPLPHTFIAEAAEANRETPIFMAHGTQDPILPITWAQASDELLTKLNYPVEFHSYPMPHTVCSEEIVDISHWLQKVLG